MKTRERVSKERGSIYIQKVNPYTEVPSLIGLPHSQFRSLVAGVIGSNPYMLSLGLQFMFSGNSVDCVVLAMYFHCLPL